MPAKRSGPRGAKAAAKAAAKEVAKRPNGDVPAGASRVDAALLGSGDLDAMTTEELKDVVERIEQAEQSGKLCFDTLPAAIASSGVGRQVAEALAAESLQLEATVAKAAVPAPSAVGG